ncbi:MAG: hypothetical protein IME99_00785 [Proteobacteria bacterium]|nr:hypothetical protein [Pseudomonadota bacterium]
MRSYFLAFSGRFNLPLLCLLLLFGTLACTEKKSESEVAPVYESHTEGEVRAEGPVTLNLLPEEPTVEGSIRAMVSGTVGSREISYMWRVDGSSVAGAGGETLESVHFVKGQSVSVTATVGTEVLSESVSVGNTVPEVRRISLTPEELYAGVDVTAEIEAVDADGDEVGYSIRWFVNGSEVVTVLSNRIEGRQFAREDEISVEVVPYDADGDGVLYAPLSVTVPNGPPSFTSLPNLSFLSDEYLYQAVAVDPDGDELIYSLGAGPEGMAISEEGLVTWKIGIMGVGTHEVELVATDPEGAEAFQKYDLAIEIR